MDAYKVKVLLRIKGDDRQFTYKFVVGLDTDESLEAFIFKTFQYYEVVEYTFKGINNFLYSETFIQKECEKIDRQNENEKLIR